MNGLIAEGIGREEGRRACYFSAAHPQKSKAVPHLKNRQPQLVLSVHQKWHTDTIYEIDLINAQEMGLTYFQSFSYVVFHFGDIPAECIIARVVGYDQTILHERRSEVAPHTLARQEDFRASGGRLHDPDHKHLTEKSLKKIYLLQYQEKGSEVNARTAEWHSAQGNADLSDLMVIDDLVQCKACKIHSKWKVLLHMWSTLQELPAEESKTLKETTAQVTIRLSCLQWRVGQEV